ncbi:MAG: hypothetical protein Q9228_008028, partial [Teloschistes exilis]
MFHLDHPDTLAFIGPCKGPSVAAINNSDLAAQAITQVWAGRYRLPDRKEMDAWCDKVYAKNLRQLSVWRLGKTATNAGELEYWLNEAAGNGVNEAMDWGWTGSKFWWGDRKLYSLIKDGISTPFVYRLFDGRPGSRKKWDGATEAILKANGVLR